MHVHQESVTQNPVNTMYDRLCLFTEQVSTDI